MSLFKKPKRNIRRRGEFGNVDENDAEDVDAKGDSEGVGFKKNALEKKVKKEIKKQSVLSFEEEWNEADDGEVFQVKKSSQSKKIRKLLDKERKKKKEPKSEENASKLLGATKEITVDDEITIKIKNPLPIPRVLNGKAALATAADLPSSEEEDEEETGPGIMRHRFSHPDHMKQLLKSGGIPDAAMIHAARKRRQEAREMGEYIPVATDDNEHKFEGGGSKSRLVREDENDNSDDEGIRLKMSLNMSAADKEKRREAFDAAQDDEPDDLDRGEDDEWEKQQIRKGVTGAQLVAVQQENLYYQQFMSQDPAMTASAVVGMAPVIPMAMQSIPSVDCSVMPVFPPLPIEGDALVDPPSVVKKLKNRLSDLKEVHRRHVLDCDSMETELDLLKKEKDRLKTEAPTLGERFRFYQDLRGYVTDLVECLDEKVIILTALEQRLNNLYARRCSDLTSRRRQDVKDQAEELAPASAASSKNLKRNEERVRRAAEREGRRIRRIRMREQKGILKHVDGFSSDDEITEMEASSFRSQKDLVEQDAKHVFEDALDEFSTVKGVLQRFDGWRVIDIDAYSEAYVNLCLPKVLGPLIRLKLITWNPLYQNGSGISGDLEKTAWCHSLFMYGSKQRLQSEESLKTDPDLQLVPRVIEKIVIPKLNQLVEVSWDPVSTSQTLSLVQLVTHLIQQYPTLSNDSKNLTTLLNTIVTRLRDAVENDVFIPIYPRHLMESKINVFFQRQFASGVKLLSNLVRWQGILNDQVVFELALDSVLNRYLLSATRTCEPLHAAAKCHMIGSVLPKIWLQPGGFVPQQLVPLLNHAKFIAQQLDPTKPLHRDAIEKLNSLLRVAS